jgi:hypothetical protein
LDRKPNNNQAEARGYAEDRDDHSMVEDLSEYGHSGSESLQPEDNQLQPTHHDHGSHADMESEEESGEYDLPPSSMPTPVPTPPCSRSTGVVGGWGPWGGDASLIRQYEFEMGELVAAIRHLDRTINNHSELLAKKLKHGGTSSTSCRPPSNSAASRPSLVAKPPMSPRNSVKPEKVIEPIQFLLKF